MTRRPERTAQVEGWVQVGLMLAVGGVAAAASFSHVVSLAQGHGQPGWLAYADAAVIETLALASGLEIRRRRRVNRPVRALLAVLTTAVVLSLACQVAEAELSVWGWLMAAVPAVGFLTLAKMAMGRTVAQAAPVKPQGQPRVTVGVNPQVTPPVTRPSAPPVADRTPLHAVGSGTHQPDLAAWVLQEFNAGVKRAEVIRQGMAQFGVSDSTVIRRWNEAKEAQEAAS